MSYITQAPTGRPIAILGAAGIPTAFAALLIVGLAVDAVRVVLPGNLTVIDPTLSPPPPPEEITPDPKPKANTSRLEPIVVPPMPNPISDTPAPFDVTTTLPPLGGDIDLGGEIGPVVENPGLGEAVTPIVEIVGASPSNSPSRWVRDSDYRAIWIRRGMSGTARFNLDIDRSGRVTDCTITRSTGHAALDTATCALVSKRARFDAAQNSAGATVSGTYSSSINWQIPE
ncbi:MAG: TonB family protein [Erythrobacter sp.]